MKKIFQFLEIIGVLIVIIGPIVLLIPSIFKRLSTETTLSIIIGLIGSLGLYILAANKLGEKRIEALESKQLCLSKEVTQEDWYKELLLDVLSAKTEIQITHHSPVLPIGGGASARKKLWDTLVEKMVEQHILFRWIVAISNEEKLEWVISIIEKYKNNDMFHINYSPVELEYPAPPQSIQIIDRKKAYVIDMSKGKYIREELGIGLISEDPHIIIQFQGYYNSYWNRTIKLKEGTLVYNKNLEELKKKIKET